MQAEDKIGVREDNGGTVQGRKERSLSPRLPLTVLTRFSGKA
jgi:hypothetical protein